MAEEVDREEGLEEGGHKMDLEKEDQEVRDSTEDSETAEGLREAPDRRGEQKEAPGTDWGQKEVSLDEEE